MPGLQKDVRELPFVEGPDTKTDPKLSAKPAVVYNSVIEGGTIAKVPGRETMPSAIAGGGTQSKGEALFTFEDELTRINGGTAYGLAEKTDQWVAKAGGNNYCALSKAQLVRSVGTVSVADHVIVGTVGVVAWFGGFASGSSALHVAVYDTESGTFYQTGVTALAGSTVSSVRLVALGTTVVLVGGAGTNIQTTTIDTTSPSTAPAALTTIRTDALATATTFDAFTYNAGMGVCVYPSTGGATLTVFAFGPAGTVLASPALATFAALVGANGFIAAGVHANRITNGNIVIVFGDTSASLRTRFIVISSVFASVVAVTSIVVPPNWDGATNANMLNATSVELTANQLTVIMTNDANRTPSNVPTWLGKVVLDSAGIVTAFADIPSTQGLVITSDVIGFDGVFAFGAINADVFDGITGSTLTGLQATAYVITTDGVVIARALPSLTGLWGNTLNGSQRVARSSATDTTSSFVFPEQGRLGIVSNDIGLANVTPVGITRIDVTKANAGSLPIVRVGETAYIGGGLPRTYDGIQVAEAGFAHYPVVATLTAAGAAGGLSTGTYFYKVLWSWVNAQGELVRGPPSPAAELAATATNTATLTIETMPLSMRDRLPQGVQVTIELYRTVANGSIFYRLGSIASITTNQVAFASVAATRTIDFTDAVSDANVVAGELLYAQNGVLDWDAPPAFSAACAHMDRLIGISSEDPFTYFVSSQWVPGEQLRFSTVNSYSVPGEKGALVAPASMDGKLILLAEKGAYAVLGDGPDNLGLNGYGPPQPITGVDSGPLSPSSIVVTPLGIMYQAEGGWMLIDRGMNASLIGAEVQQFVSGPYRVRGALVDAKNERVRILSDPGSDIVGAQTGQLVPSNGGVELVYDYFYRQWAVEVGRGGQACCLYKGELATVRSDGVVRRYSPDTWRDAGNYVSSTVETGWVKLGGLNGFQRVWYMELLGTYWSDCTVTVEVAYDYDGTSPTVPTWYEVAPLDGTGVYTVDGGPLLLRHHLGRKCVAVKFRITDSALAGDGRGMALTALGLEFGLKRGLFKLPARQTA